MARRKILTALLSLSMLTAVSRVLGLCRDIICANVFGASAAFDSFLVAFQIPNFMRRLFAEGAFSQAFVPLYSSLDGSEQMIGRRKVFVADVLGILSVTLCLLTLLVWLFSPWVIKLYAPGFMIDHGANRLVLAASILRWTFPYLACISLTACIAAILNSHGRFWAGGLMPIILNCCLITAAVCSAVFFGGDIMILARSVALAGVIQLLSIYGYAKSQGYVLGMGINWQQPMIRRMVKLMGLGLLGAIVGQMSLIADTFLASLLKVGSISWLYYSQRLVYLPVGMFAVAISTVIMPLLSKAVAKKNQQGYGETLAWSIQLIWLLSLPAMVGLILLAHPIILIFFRHGSFSAYEAHMTSMALVAMAFGLPAFMFNKILVSGFYAQQDMKTPVKVGFKGFFVNIIGSLILMHYIFHVGIAFATSLSAWFQVYWYQKQLSWKKELTSVDFMTPLISTLVMTIVLWLITPGFEYWSHCSLVQAILLLLVLITVAIGVYEICLKVMRLSLLEVFRKPPKADFL